MARVARRLRCWTNALVNEVWRQKAPSARIEWDEPHCSSYLKQA